MTVTDRQKFVLKSLLIYAAANRDEINESFSPCPYCGGTCLLYAEEGEWGCDGYLGDVDGHIKRMEEQVKQETGEGPRYAQLNVDGDWGYAISSEDVEDLLQELM